MFLNLVEAKLPRSLAGPILADAHGIPRYWAMAWIVLEGAGKAESNLRSKLPKIERLYQAVEKRLGSDCLDRILTDSDMQTLKPALEGFFIELRNRGLDSGASSNKTWEIAISFVRSTITRIGYAGAIEQLDKLHAQIQTLDALYSQLLPLREFKAFKPRALPAAVLEDLYEIIDPTSKRNPFRNEGNAFRNYTLVILILHQGLRRGEPCLLPIDAIKDDIDRRSGITRSWINISENPYETNDPRSTKPTLKTPDARRQLPISEDLVAVVDAYVRDYRGSQNHSFLFSSQKSRPLSLGMVNLVFKVLSKSLSPAAKKELWDRREKRSITPHDLRHTAAVIRLTEFLDAGESMDVALDKLKIFFGWTKDSEMPRHYSRAYFEDRLTSVWNTKFDAHIDRLKRLEAGSVA